MSEDDWRVDYAEVTAATAGWPEFAEAVAERWLDRYRAATPWEPSVVEIALGDLTYLFDMAPSEGALGDDRVVGVWGRPAVAAGARDQARQRGFIPEPSRWSLAGYDRGHFVAHSLGGGMGVNFFPQAAALNRGLDGRTGWKRMEARAREATLLLVRPVYASPTWVPRRIEYGVVVGGELRVEVFDNRP